LIAQAAFDVSSNVLRVFGHGIVASTDRLRIVDNDIAYGKDDNAAPPDATIAHGIYITAPHSGVVRDGQILDNRIGGFPGGGIFVQSALQDAMIKQNQIERVRVGIALECQLCEAAIENNQISLVTEMALQARLGTGALIISANMWTSDAPGALAACEMH